VAFIAAVSMIVCSAPASGADDALDAQILVAYRAAYNLDHETALRTARAATTRWPDESRAHRTLASILWLQALFHRGAVTVDHYMGGLTGSTITLPEPPASIETAFRTSLGHAIALAEARLARAPRDPDAHYDAGAAYGLHASWTASVEGRIRGAFGMARRAYKAQERVLELDPTRVGAGTVVGTYRYAVAGLGLASRVVAYLAGFGGDKARGIALLEAATTPGSESGFEARTALVLIYSREGRHEDAFRLLTSMSAEFPQNRILVLERGAAAVRAGRAREADTILSEGIERLDADTRRRLPGEHALWFYRRGLARLAQNRPTAAAADLDAALQRSPETWIRGRIELALGKVADVTGRRADARDLYRRARDTARAANDPVVQAEASRLLARPFVLSRSFTNMREIHGPRTAGRHDGEPGLV
jgi:tetratricopeptide (TPR) repeat protein